MGRFKILVLLVIMVGSAFAYHEFKVPKKAYKKVTIEYFNNEVQSTTPCSTVYLYYDKNDVEIYREVKKGCCNPIQDNVLDSIDVLRWYFQDALIDPAPRTLEIKPGDLEDTTIW